VRLPRLIPPLAVLALIAGCSSGDDGTGDSGDGPATASIRTTTTAVADPSAGPGTTATSTVVVTAPSTTARPPPTVGDPRVSSEVIGTFTRPVDVVVRPGDDHFWIVEQTGRVVRYDGADAVVALDVRDRVSDGNEQGLLGLAFSPDGSRAYTNRTDPGGDTQITEYAVATDGTFDASSARVVLAVDQPFANHNAGDLAFGPDGMLYIPLGDGGSGGDPDRRASDPSSLLGSLLRIDPSPTDDAPYSIPAGNPGVNDPALAPEVWSWGLRNPWKIAFDPATGELWIADVGQNRFEEVDVVGATADAPAGRAVDFGWSAFEGTERFNDDVVDTGEMTPPVLTYSHDDGCSISGGVPYRGSAIAELEPAYVYSDFCTGTIWALDLSGSRNLTLLEGFEGVTAVRTGPDGELYVLERGGDIHRLIPA